MKFRWLLLPLLSLAALPALADTSSFVQGVNYVKVDPAQATDAKPGQIEVIEFFWYGCPHCFGVEPYLQAWLKTKKPANVVFKHVPAAMPNSEFYTDAQAYFVADILGVEDKIHEPFFNAIHLGDQEALRDDKNAIKDWFAKNAGVSPQDFDNTWDSFGVQTRMTQAQKLADRYGIQGVPTFIVNGKWMTGAGYQMDYPTVMKCVDFLVQQEEAGIKTAAPAKKKKH